MRKERKDFKTKKCHEAYLEGFYAGYYSQPQVSPFIGRLNINLTPDYQQQLRDWDKAWDEGWSDGNKGERSGKTVALPASTDYKPTGQSDLTSTDQFQPKRNFLQELREKHNFSNNGRAFLKVLIDKYGYKEEFESHLPVRAKSAFRQGFAAYKEGIGKANCQYSEQTIYNTKRGCHSLRTLWGKGWEKAEHMSLGIEDEPVDFLKGYMPYQETADLVVIPTYISKNKPRGLFHRIANFFNGRTSA